MYLNHHIRQFSDNFTRELSPLILYIISVVARHFFFQMARCIVGKFMFVADIFYFIVVIELPHAEFNTSATIVIW